MNAGPFQFEWDEGKADANVRKHGVTFDLASTVFHDPSLLTIADLDHSETEERWFSVGCASTGVVLSVVYLWSAADPAATIIRLISARKSTQAENLAVPGEKMNRQPIEDNDMPGEIDFSKGVRGLHHIPAGAKVMMPASIEKSVWMYFSGKAEERGVPLSELLSEVLKRDIEINEALK